MIPSHGRHVYLIGFMGTGKSTVGRELSKRLSRQFYDTDDLVVAMTHKSIPQIFADHGEDTFRHFEAKALRLCINSPQAVIALGGGAPMVPSIAQTVRQTGRTILLTADWQTIWKRLQGDGSRPLLQGESSVGMCVDADEFIRHVEPLLAARRSTYDDLADWTIDVSKKSVSESVDDMAEWLTGTC